MAKKIKDNGNTPAELRFHYLKGTHFRVIHVDGAIGGVTPQGNIHISLFNERQAIPREQLFELSAEGKMGEIKETVSRDGVVREMEVDAVLSLSTAISIRDWLNNNIGLLEKKESKGEG